MSHGNDISDWRVIDPRPGVSLTDILPYSDRARALIFRKSTSPILHTNFLQVRGAVSILGGLDYHRDRFIEIIAQLTSGKLKRDAPAMHEAVAYVNRAGQFYYFANSDLVRARGERPPIPMLEDVMYFRHKYTAHRSIDQPRSSDTDVLQAAPDYAHEPLLQHYGIRSRWIDLVDNVWVALWFGCYDFVLNGRRHEQAHFQPRSAREHLFVLFFLTGSSDENADKPGFYENDSLYSIDLRKACPSVFLRPHSQHALLARRKKLERISDVDMMNDVVGVIRVSVGDAFSWIGYGDLLSVRNLFPPPHYDFGYAILLDNAPPGNRTLGSITSFFP